MKIPTTQELADQHLVSLEGAIAQTSPLNNKAFLRVLAVLLAMGHTGLYKLAIERSTQNLALTATGDDLALIGSEIGIFPKSAESAILTVTIPATTGVTIPATASFTGDLNGLLYTVNGSAVSVAGAATLSLTASEPGTTGNLQVTDTLSLVSPLPGVGSAALVTSIANVGAEDEKIEDYRARVLFELRATKGGGNPTDYKTWGEEVAGVVRIFPYAGKPVGGGTSYPGDRTIYVQADTTIDPDGVPAAGLLAEVRAALNTDPTTGKSRPGLGLVDSTLYVQPIVRTAFDVIVTNLVTPAGAEADVRAEISAALALYFPLFSPYVDGVDALQDRNDRVTTPALSTALQEVFDATGSSAAGVAFSVASVGYSAYQLAAGELAKRGLVTYATV